MTQIQSNKKVKSGGNTPALKPVYYLSGTDGLRIEQEAAGIVAAALRPGLETFNYEAFDGKESTAADVLRAASTLPAFSDKRVVVVKDAGLIKAAEAASYIDYLNDPCPSTCLVFIAPGRPDKKFALVQAVIKAGYLKAIDCLSAGELPRWIAGEAKKQGKTITPAASARLVEIVGTQLRDITGELNKVILYAGENPQIEAGDVEDCCSECRQDTGFALTNAIAAKDVKTALKVLEKESNKEPLMILGSIARQIRIILKLKALLRKRVSQGGLAASAGIPPFLLDEYTKNAGRFSERELVVAVGKLRRADMDLKTGRAPESVVLPRLIMELCAGKGKTG